MKRYAILLSAALAGFVAGRAAAAPSADEVMARVDANASFGTIRYAGRMEIAIGGETRVKTMRAVAQGSDKAFVEFTNPEDRGTRYLKLGKKLWMYFPRERETVPIAGELLKQGMMGSDLSYEDALESRDYKELYAASLAGEESVDGRACLIVRLEAKSDGAPYASRVLWVDAERWVSLKEEMYARSGKLLKVSRSLDVERIEGRWFPTRVELESKLRRGTKTIFAMDSVKLDEPVDQREFTMGALTK